VAAANVAVDGQAASNTQVRRQAIDGLSPRYFQMGAGCL